MRGERCLLSRFTDKTLSQLKGSECSERLQHFTRKGAGNHTYQGRRDERRLEPALKERTIAEWQWHLLQIRHHKSLCDYVRRSLHMFAYMLFYRYQIQNTKQCDVFQEDVSELVSTLDCFTCLFIMPIRCIFESIQVAIWRLWRWNWARHINIYFVFSICVHLYFSKHVRTSVHWPLNRKQPTGECCVVQGLCGGNVKWCLCVRVFACAAWSQILRLKCSLSRIII